MKHCGLCDIVNSEIAEDTKFWTVVLWILPDMHADLDLLRVKSIFGHPTLVSVWFWPSNSKTGYP